MMGYFTEVFVFMDCCDSTKGTSWNSYSDAERVIKKLDVIKIYNDEDFLVYIKKLSINGIMIEWCSGIDIIKDAYSKYNAAREVFDNISEELRMLQEKCKRLNGDIDFSMGGN